MNHQAIEFCKGCDEVPVSTDFETETDAWEFLASRDPACTICGSWQSHWVEGLNDSTVIRED
jgi:hypothetical protein